MPFVHQMCTNGILSSTKNTSLVLACEAATYITELQNQVENIKTKTTQMLLLNLLGYGVISFLLALFMAYKKKWVLAVAFLFMALVLSAVALMAMYVYPEKSPF